MPGCFVFHKGNALTFYSFCNDCGWFTLYGTCFVVSGLDLIKIMSINIDNVETECLEFFINRVWGHNVLDAAIDLQAVIVHEDAQVVQIIMRSKHSSFPNLTFLNLAIAQNSVDTIVCTGQFCCLCHTACSRNALSQRTGGHIYTWNFLHIRMSLQAGADFTQTL